MSISNREFSKRRKDLMSQMESNSIAILASAVPSIRNNDAEYQYRQNSDFYYLTGFSEPRALLALIPGRRQAEAVVSTAHEHALYWAFWF